MGAYLIADVHITDPATYEEYKRQVSPLIARFGGRYAARAGRHEVLEGDWEPHRLVVLEFPDMAALKEWYESPEYLSIKAIRERAATSRLIAVEGLDLGPTLGRFDQQVQNVIDSVQLSLDKN